MENKFEQIQEEFLQVTVAYDFCAEYGVIEVWVPALTASGDIISLPEVIMVTSDMGIDEIRSEVSKIIEEAAEKFEYVQGEPDSPDGCGYDSYWREIEQADDF